MKHKQILWTLNDMDLQAQDLSQKSFHQLQQLEQIQKQ